MQVQGKPPAARALPSFVATPAGCFLYGGVNATRVPFCDLWRLEPLDTSDRSASTSSQHMRWHACKPVPMCPMEHAMGPDEAAVARSAVASDRVAVGHDGHAWALTNDTQLVVRTPASLHGAAIPAAMRTLALSLNTMDIHRLHFSVCCE